MNSIYIFHQLFDVCFILSSCPFYIYFAQIYFNIERNFNSGYLVFQCGVPESSRHCSFSKHFQYTQIHRCAPNSAHLCIVYSPECPVVTLKLKALTTETVKYCACLYVKRNLYSRSAVYNNSGSMYSSEKQYIDITKKY